MKKYLDDKAIEQANEDKFGHLNLANQIAHIVDEQSSESPVNIGIFGKWGVGKTSVIELLEKEIFAKRESDGKFKFIRVNVWKYQSITSIRNKIFYQIAKELGVEEKVKNIYENSTTTVNHGAADVLPEFLNPKQGESKLLLWLTYALLAFAVIFILYFIYSYNPKFSLVISTVTTAIVSYGILKAGMDYLLKTFIKTTTTQSKPFESEEQFEHAVIELFNKPEFKDTKKILFIDDLDRCSSNKVLNTLETIKTFLQINNCIFIVACDHDLIRKAVIDSNKEFNYTDKDGANYLEKFFQYFIYIPPYLPNNLRTYTKNLIVDAGLSISTELNKDKLDAVIYIIAYKDIINPRKVKVLLNSFIFDYYSIKEKEKDEKHPIQSGVITNFPERLAILTVLKVDFPLFVNDLIADPTLSSKIAYGDREIDNPFFLEKYFGSESTEPSEDVKQLQNYLFLVKDWIPRDFTPYLFVSVESMDLEGFPSVDAVKYLNLIRNGSADIIQEMKELPVEDQLKITAAIGNLQESLSNTIERRNVTVIFTSVVAEFPEVLKAIKSAEALYAFKTNIDSLFQSSETFGFVRKKGLIRIINHFYELNFYEQGYSLLGLVQRKLLGEENRIGFLLKFLCKDLFKDIKSNKLKDDLTKDLHKLFNKFISYDNYSRVVGDILEMDQDLSQLEKFYAPLIRRMAEISMDEFTNELEKDPASKYEPKDFVDLLLKFKERNAQSYVVDFLEEIAVKNEKLYKIYINACAGLFKGDNILCSYIFQKEVDTFAETDEAFVTDLLSMVVEPVVENVDGKISIKKSIETACLKGAKHLSYNDAINVDVQLIRIFSLVYDNQNLDPDTKVSFLNNMIAGYTNIVMADESILWLLDKCLMHEGQDIIIFTVTSIFVDSIKSIKNINLIENFLSKYSVLIDPKVKSFDKDLLKKIFEMHTNQKAPHTSMFIADKIELLRKPVSLIYVCEALEKKQNDESVAFCVNVLNSNQSYTNTTNLSIKNQFPGLFRETYVKAGETGRYWKYSTALRGRMIEILLIHTDFDFENNILTAISQSSSLIINSFRTLNGLMKLNDRLIKENDPKAPSFQNSISVLRCLCRITNRSSQENFDAIIRYVFELVKTVFLANASNKKSQVNSVFQLLIEEFKPGVYKLSASQKRGLLEIFDLALEHNGKLAKRVDKLMTAFNI